MFGLFGGKKATSSTDTILRDDAHTLRTEIQRIQHELSTVLESKGRATKDERTTIVTSSLDTFRKVDTFLAKYTK
tara:strand:- start:278 stop:502 length:225 start_codon:yes stop_codon:yes gene_type:complete